MNDAWRGKVVASWGNQCVCHAFSVMRLALGYGDGMPEGYELPPGGPGWHQIEIAAVDFFPEHVVFCVRTVDWAYFRDLCAGMYMFAWAYADSRVPEEEKKAHMVVGTPYLFNPMEVIGIVAVSLEKKGSSVESGS